MIYFLSPFYNEEEFLPKFLQDLTKSASKLAKKNYKIVLVDDGSRDQSLVIARSFGERFPIMIITYKNNKGVDYAFKLGFTKIFNIAKNDDQIVTLESDNTSDISILPKMLKKSGRGVDIVLASCYAKGGGIYGTGIFRQVASRIVNFILYIIFPIKGVKTYSSFYRVYKVSTLKKIWKAYEGKLIEQKGFACMVEILIKCSKLPIKIEEVPMVLRWENRRGKSKMKIGKTVLGYGSLANKLFIKEKFGSGGLLSKARGNWPKFE